MQDPDMRQEGFLLQTDICQHSTRVKAWISITSLENSVMWLLIHAHNQKLKLKAWTMDSQQAILCT